MVSRGLRLDRPDLYVLSRFLDAIYQKGYTSKRTNIQMLSGLNYPRFEEYLQWSMEHQLVAEIEDTGCKRIVLTQKGIESYHKLFDWIKEIIEDVRL
jgi:predicted transcriptional regulator